MNKRVIQWEWGNVGVTYKLLGVWIFPFISPYWDRAYLHTTSFIRRILSSSHLDRLGITLASFCGCQSSHGVMPWTIGLLVLKKHQSCRIWRKRILFPYLNQELSRSIKSKRSHKSLGANARWKILRSSTRISLDLRRFCSTLASMLPKNIKIIISGLNILLSNENPYRVMKKKQQTIINQYHLLKYSVDVYFKIQYIVYNYLNFCDKIRWGKLRTAFI